MIIDLICLISLLLGFWIGYNRGIIHILFNLVSYTAGVVLAFKLSDTTSIILGKFFNSTNPLMFFAGFIVNLAIIMIIIRLVANALEGIFSATRMAFINQILGGVVYGGIFVLVYSVLLWFGKQTLVVNDEAKKDSISYEMLDKLPGHAKNTLIKFQPIISEIWHTTMIWLEKVRSTSKTKAEKTKIYDIEEDNSTQIPSSKGIEDFPQELITKPQPYRNAPKEYDTGIEAD